MGFGGGPGPGGSWQDPKEAKAAAEAAAAMEREAALADSRTQAIATAIVEGLGMVAQAILTAARVHEYPEFVGAAETAAADLRKHLGLPPEKFPHPTGGVVIGMTGTGYTAQRGEFQGEGATQEEAVAALCELEISAGGGHDAAAAGRAYHDAIMGQQADDPDLDALLRSSGADGAEPGSGGGDAAATGEAEN